MGRQVVNKCVPSPDWCIGSARQFNLTPSRRNAKTLNPASRREPKLCQKPRSNVSVRDRKAKPQSRQQGKSIQKVESNYRLKQGHDVLASEDSYMETTQGDLDTGTKQRLNMKKQKVQTSSTKRENTYKTDAKIADELCTEADENCWTTGTQPKAEAKLKLASKIKHPCNGFIRSYPSESNVFPNKPVDENSSVSHSCIQADVCLCVKQPRAFQTVEENSLKNSCHDSRLERMRHDIRRDFMFVDRYKKENDILAETELCTGEDFQKQSDLAQTEILTKYLEKEKKRADCNERENEKLKSCLNDFIDRYGQKTEVLKQDIYRLKEENRELHFKCKEAESDKNENSAFFQICQTNNLQLRDEMNVLKDTLSRKNEAFINLEGKFKKLLKDRGDEIYCLQIQNRESETNKRQATELFNQVVKFQNDNAEMTKDLKYQKHSSDEMKRQWESLLKEKNDLIKGQEEKDAVCNQLRNEKTELEKKVSKLYQSLSQLQIQLRQVQEENDVVCNQLTNEKTELKEKVSKLYQSHSQLQQENSTLAEALRLGEEQKRNESEEYVRQLKEELKDVKQQLNSTEKEILKYRKKCEDLQHRLKDLTEDKEGADRKRTEEECKHAEYKEASTKELNHWQVKLTEKENRLASETQRCAQLNEMNSNLQIQIQELQEKVKLLSDDSQRAKDGKQKDFESTILTLRNKIIDLENDRRELLRKTEEQTEERNKEVVRSKMMKHEFDEIHKVIQDQLKKQVCDISALNAEVTHWKVKLMETENLLASEIQRYAQLNEANGNLQIQIQELQEKAKLLSNDSQRAENNKQKDLESIILTLQQKLANLKNDRKELLRKTEEQKEEIRKDMQDKLEKQACDIRTLTAEVYQLKQVEKDKLGLQEEKLIELQMFISSLEDENRILTQDNKNVTASLKSIQEDQEKEVSLMKNDLVSQTEQNQNLHSKINLLREEKQKIINENLLLSKTLNQQEKEYKETLSLLQLESGKHLETSILKYDRKLRHLQQENKALRCESSETKKQKEKLDVINKQLNDELQHCKKEVESLEEEKASLKEIVEHMQQTKKRHDSIISELHKTVELREQELSSFTSETKSVERTKKENVELKENLLLCEQEVKNLKAEITSSETKLQAIGDGYERQISRLNQEIKEKTVKLDQTENVLRQKENIQTEKFRQMYDEKEDMSVQLGKAKADIERLMGSLETAKQNELQLNQEKSENLKELHGLQIERKFMQDSYRNLEDNLRAEEKNAEMLEMKIQDINSHNENLCKENEMRILHLNEEIISLKSVNDKLNEKTRETDLLKEEVSRLQMDRIPQLQISKENQQLRDELDCMLKQIENSSKALEQEKLLTEKRNQKHLRLQQEVERRENETARLRHDLHACSEKQSEFSKCISELQEENKRLNGNVSLAKHNLAQAKSEIKRLNAENGRLENTLQQQIQENREVLSAAKIKMEEENGTISRMHQTIAAQKEEIDKLRSEYQILKTSVRQTDNERSKLMKQRKDSESDLKQQLGDTKDQLDNVQKELDDTKTRLSRAMGDRLTDNNPNITDLSDKNRPTKISERYQELYDNQWTDAFEVVDETNGDEKISIEVLKDILMDTVTFCTQEAERQMKQLVCTLSKGKDIQVQLLKQLKDARKSTAETYGKQVFEEYKMKLSGSRSERDKIACEVMDFVYECFQVSWLMAVQDPPVVLGPDIATGETFNKDHYKAYTKSGTTIQYIVWPVLLLHQGGPVLCKGVAQG